MVLAEVVQKQVELFVERRLRTRVEFETFVGFESRFRTHFGHRKIERFFEEF
jgi:hypothetical protein